MKSSFPKPSASRNTVTQLPIDPPKSQAPSCSSTVEECKHLAGKCGDVEKGLQAPSIQSVHQRGQAELKGSDMGSRAPERKQFRWSSAVDVRSNHAATGGRASQSVMVPANTHSMPGQIFA